MLKVFWHDNFRIDGMTNNNNNFFETSIYYQVITYYNYTSHYIRQRTIDCQYNLWKQNYIAVKVTDRFQHGKAKIDKTIKLEKASNFWSDQGLFQR